MITLTSSQQLTVNSGVESKHNFAVIGSRCSGRTMVMEEIFKVRREKENCLWVRPHNIEDTIMKSIGARYDIVFIGCSDKISPDVYTRIKTILKPKSGIIIHDTGGFDNIIIQHEPSNYEIITDYFGPDDLCSILDRKTSIEQKLVWNRAENKTYSIYHKQR